MVSKRTNWKKKAQELEAELCRVLAYAFDYGNATGECRAGYLQQEGLICHQCGADDQSECRLKATP